MLPPQADAGDWLRNAMQGGVATNTFAMSGHVPATYASASAVMP